MKTKGQVDVGLNLKFFLIFILVIGFGFAVIIEVNRNADTVSNTPITESAVFLLQNGSSQAFSGNIGSVTATTPNNAWVSYNEDNIGNTQNVSYLNSSVMDIDGLFETSFTVSFWYYVRGLTPGGLDNGILGVGFIDRAYGSSNWVIYNTGSTNLWLRFQNESTAVGSPLTLSGSNQVSLDKWYFVTGMWNSTNGNATFWINGSFMDSGVKFAENGYRNESYSLWIAAPPNMFPPVSLPTQYKALNGTVDELRIYNRTLTQAEITEIYDSGRTANSSLPNEQLALWYSFNENTGSTTYDKSANAVNGELISHDTASNLAVYQTDGVTNTLVSAIDYITSGSDFELINDVYEYSLISADADIITTRFSSSGVIIELGALLLIVAILAIIFYKIRRDFQDG